MMKKSLQIGIVLFLIGHGSFAQWSGAGTNDITSPIYRDGSVGIGTGSTNIIRKLTVALSQQNDGIWLNNYGNGNRDISISTNCTQGAWNSLTQPGDHLIMWKAPNIDDASAGGLVIGPWSNFNKGLRITPDGNVGIGTANPGNWKLAVEGKIAAREIQVTLDSFFPDYVFSPSYKLRNLFSLEKYINQHQHLPGIPSAKEVEKEGGIKLGEMNIKLLEKVEELTLYVIELKKEIEEIKKKSNNPSSAKK